MRTRLLTACAAATLVASPVHAWVNTIGGAGNALNFTWTGFYAGINAGYGRFNSDWDFQGDGSTSYSDDAGAVGVQTGYDAQLSNNLFLGLEASLDASRAGGSSSCLNGASCHSIGNAFGDISARLGVSQNQALFYLKAGAAFTDVTHHIERPGGPYYEDDGGASAGWLVGGGIEYALLYNLTAKAEYNYMDFGSYSNTVGDTHINTKEQINLVKLGLNLKFN